MKTLLDTSVLVAASVASHPDHDRCLPCLQRGRRGELDLYVSTHSLAEFYAVLTTLPVKPAITPQLAARLTSENVVSIAQLVALDEHDYRMTIDDLAARDLRGGIIYDALIAKAAGKAEVDSLLTLNPDDFRRVVLPDGVRIRSP